MASISNGKIILPVNDEEVVTSRAIDILPNRDMILYFDRKASVFQVDETDALDTLNSVLNPYLLDGTTNWQLSETGTILSVLNQIMKGELVTTPRDVMGFKQTTYSIYPNVYDKTFCFLRVKISEACDSIKVFYKEDNLTYHTIKTVLNPEVDEWIDIYLIATGLTNISGYFEVQFNFSASSVDNSFEVDATNGIYACLITDTAFQQYSLEELYSVALRDELQAFIEVKIIDPENEEEVIGSPNSKDYGDIAVIDGVVLHGHVGEMTQYAFKFNTRYLDRHSNVTDTEKLLIQFGNKSPGIAYEIENILLKYEGGAVYKIITEILVEVQNADFTQAGGQIMTVPDYTLFEVGLRTDLYNGTLLIIGGLMILDAGVLSNGYDFVILKYDSESWVL